MNQRIATRVARAALCSAFCMLVAVTAQAWQSHEGIISINGGSMTVALGANPQKIEDSAADPASLVKIYSDLGTGQLSTSLTSGGLWPGLTLVQVRSLRQPLSHPNVISILFSSKLLSSRCQARMA